MADLPSSAQRATLLMTSARFITLATAYTGGRPWASTVNYVLLRTAPLRLVWYSMRRAQHSRNIETGSEVTGSIFRTDLAAEQSPVGLDGLQLAGSARAIPEPEAAGVHAEYYRRNFPDETVRRQWMLPLAEFTDTGPRRFYELTVERLWLLDLARWLEDKVDARLEIENPQALLTPAP